MAEIGKNRDAIQILVPHHACCVTSNKILKCLHLLRLKLS